jgi:tungstate transport system substrate-binding protein
MRALTRRLAIAGTTGMAALGVLGGVAHADTSTSFNVVGTSDVSDSGLMPNLIKPGFQAAFPNDPALNYTGSATGAAISAAKAAGSATSPSVLIVHAASLENSFVSGGFSYNNSYGNAIFRNDFVLTGPSANEASKANVLAKDPHNIAQAFADIATAGVTGTATFVSRGGNTSTSGTTAEERAIWALVYTANLLPASDSADPTNAADFVLCTVSAADGGGMNPIRANVQVNGANIVNGAPCPTAAPDSGSVASGDAPSWYAIPGGSQSAALTATNTCTVGTAGTGSCYTLTDRGTFDYLNTGGTATAGPTTIPNLQVVTRDNSATAPGGRYALINYFHAYIISPTTGAPNLQAAQDLISYLTSPSFQSKVGTYLASTGDPDGAPFTADASPIITASGLPSAVTPGTKVTVSGNVSNAEVGYPTLAGEPVAVDQVVNGVTIPVAFALGTTDNNGNYSITFTPPSTGSYQVVTPQISQIENSTLNPIYGDLLTPGASAATAITVQAAAVPATGVATIKSTTGEAGFAKVTGTVSPAVPDANGHIAILARKATSKGAFAEVGGFNLRVGQTTFNASVTLAAGKWQLEALYTDPGTVTAATSKAEGVTVAGLSTTAAITKAKATKGKLSLSAKLSQAAPAAATVEVLAVQTAHTSGAKLASAAKAKQVAKVTLKKGKSTFTLSAKLTRGYRYNLQLAYVQKGKATTYSKFVSLSVS